MTLTEAAENIGREVIYAHPYCPQPEDGVITSVATYWVFVRYGNDSNSKATDPAHLRFAEVTA